MTSPAQLINIWKLRPKKQLGQNFLIEPSTAEMIVRRSGLQPPDVVLEIGAGLGALTVPLARIARKVYAVEKDKQLIEVLRNILVSNDCDNVILLNENILAVNITRLAHDESVKLVVYGNLPYNISSQILVHLISARAAVSHCVLMFQKELAQRIASPSGSKTYGRLSVMLQYCADIRCIAKVKASLFYPKPKVDSEIIEIKFRTEPIYVADDEEFFFRVVKAAFSKRRKTLKNAISGSGLVSDSATAARLLEAAGIDPSRRAETLGIEEFVKLGNRLLELHVHTGK
jgi:16S rRNA (adenine1518-N6/adenine1519-N6)-dimethyltransferase